MTSPPNLVRPPQRQDTAKTQEQFRDRPVVEQVETAAATDTTLYTVPKGRMASVRVYFCENGAATATIRIAIRKAGAALADAHYVRHTYALAASEDGVIGPFELAADDVITVRASTATVSWTCNGYDRPRDTT